MQSNIHTHVYRGDKADSYDDGIDHTHVYRGDKADTYDINRTHFLVQVKSWT